MNILYQIKDTFWLTPNNGNKKTFLATQVRRNLAEEHSIYSGLTLIDAVGMEDYEDLTSEEIGQLFFGN